MDGIAKPKSPPEVWRAIPGFEGRYEFSSWGNVRTLHHIVMRRDGKPCTVHPRIRRICTNKAGDRHVLLGGGGCGGKYRCIYIGALLAQLFPDAEDLAA
jgi:hypothetical protein